VGLDQRILLAKCADGEVRLCWGGVGLKPGGTLAAPLCWRVPLAKEAGIDFEKARRRIWRICQRRPMRLKTEVESWLRLRGRTLCGGQDVAALVISEKARRFGKCGFSGRAAAEEALSCLSVWLREAKSQWRCGSDGVDVSEIE